MTGPCYLAGIDIGGTAIKAAIFAADGTVLERDTRPTRDGEVVGGVPAWADAVRALVAGWASARGGAPAAIGVACPGLPAADGRSIRSMPVRMAGLEGFDFTTYLERGDLVPVANDAHAALLGEAWQGAARGLKHAVLLTLGTGVGGAVLADGRLLRGHIGRAGHLGHVSLDPVGEPGIMRTPGALEQAVGECTLLARTGGRFATTRALLDAAAAGDGQAALVWAHAVRALAAAIVSFINAFDPEAVILGGGVIQAGDRLWSPLAHEMDAIEWRPDGHGVPIVPAQLGGWAGTWGAAWLAAHPEAR